MVEMYWWDIALWTIGLMACALAALVVLWLAFELLVVGLANSISLHRWMLANKTKPIPWHMWLRLPWFVLVEAWRLMGHRNLGNATWTNRRGAVWRGIGDWTVAGRCNPLPSEHQGRSAAEQRREVSGE